MIAVDTIGAFTSGSGRVTRAAVHAEGGVAGALLRRTEATVGIEDVGGVAVAVRIW